MYAVLFYGISAPRGDSYALFAALARVQPACLLVIARLQLVLQLQAGLEK